MTDIFDLPPDVIKYLTPYLSNRKQNLLVRSCRFFANSSISNNLLKLKAFLYTALLIPNYNGTFLVLDGQLFSWRGKRNSEDNKQIQSELIRINLSPSHIKIRSMEMGVIEHQPTLVLDQEVVLYRYDMQNYPDSLEGPVPNHLRDPDEPEPLPYEPPTEWKLEIIEGPWGNTPIEQVVNHTKYTMLRTKTGEIFIYKLIQSNDCSHEDITSIVPNTDRLPDQISRNDLIASMYRDMKYWGASPWLKAYPLKQWIRLKIHGASSETKFVNIVTNNHNIMMLSTDRVVYGYVEGISQPLIVKDRVEFPLAMIHGPWKDTPVQHIAMGESHVLVVTRNGELYSFGKNNKGQLGLGDTEPRIEFSIINNPPWGEIPIVSLVANDNGSFAITSNGEIYAWGDRLGMMLGIDKISCPEYILFPHFPENHRK